REVGARGPLAVERLGRRLRSPSHLVDRTKAEVGDLLGMTDGPFGVDERRGVAGVGGGRRVPLSERARQALVADLAREAAVSDRTEAAVPAGRRQPDLDPDVRVGAGP